MTPSRRRGVALMLVLWLVVILGVIATGVVRGARTTSSLASNVRAGTVARYAAESGIESLVAGIEDSLGAFGDSTGRRDWLNALESGRSGGDSVTLGDGRFAVTVVDVSARLDINAASQEQLRRFFSHFTDLASASDIARAIRGDIERGSDSATAGPGGVLRAVRPLRALEELRTRQLIPERVLERAAPFLTVDGDGTVNRRMASDAVLAAAAGDVREAPSRLLLLSRGWMSGHPLTHEIQAVYSVVGSRLVFSHWRERSL